MARLRHLNYSSGAPFGPEIPTTTLPPGTTGASNMAKRLLFLLLLLSALIPSHITTFAFQSDELLQDDEEFGIEGGVRSADHIEYPNSIPTPTPSSRSKKRFGSGDPSPSDSKSSVQFLLEHNLGSLGTFVSAGTFSARIKTSAHGGGAPTLTKLRFSRNDFTHAEKDAFEKLLRDDEFYTIRLPSNILSPHGKDYIISSVRARCLSKDGLDEHFVIHMDGGNILAVNYGSSGACQYPRLLKLPNKWAFNSYTVLKYSEQARRTPTFAEDVAQNAEGEGVKPVEKSFWAKYWMYLVPIGFIVMNAINQAANMAEDQPGAPAGATSAPQGQLPAQRAPNAAVRRR